MRRILLCGGILFQVNLFAQQITQEETAIVTATNSSQKLAQTGRNVVVIKPELYNGLAVNSVDELLRYAAGIEVQQRGPQGAQSDILLRGGTFQQVLVLIDGIRLNDPLTGHFNGNIPVLPSEIERIEILKGPASAIWGADAVGGVIHIITKAFVNKSHNRNMLANFQLGQYGLQNVRVNGHTQIKNDYLSLGMMSNNATGQAQRGTTGFFNLHTLHGSYRTTLKNDWLLSVKSVLDYRYFSAQNFYTTFVSDTADERVNTFFNHVRLQKNYGTSTLSFDVSYKRLRDQFQFNNVFKPNDNRSKQLLAQVNYVVQAGEDTDLVTGLQLANRSIASNDRGNHAIASAGAWLVAKHNLGKGFYLNEGLRFDYNENFGFVASPQINLAYNKGKMTYRASYARGIRDADFTERYNNYNRPLVPSGSIGNPDLKTERTWNIEAGADYIVNSELKISTTAFYRSQTDLIDWTPTPYANMPRKVNLVPTGNYALASNIDDVKTYGAELDINYNKKIDASSAVALNWNITSLTSKNDDPIPSFYIVGHAKLITTLNAMYNYKGFQIGLNGLYKERNPRNAAAIGAQITKNYFLLNTKIGYTYKEKVNFFLQAHNLFDKKYSDILGSKMPGRWMSGGIQVDL